MSILSTVAIAAAAVVAITGAAQIFGPSISTEIEIDASPEAVWSVLSDTTAYPEWNPFIREMEGELIVGATIHNTMQSGDRAPMAFSPEVMVADDSSELRWIGRLGFAGIFDGEHYFILEPTADGTTILRHGETFTGLLAYPLLAMIRSDTEAGFAAMNDALKARAETQT